MTEPDRHRILIVDDSRAIHEDFRKILAVRERAPGGLAEAEAALFGQKDDPAPPLATFEMDSALQGREALDCVQRAAADGRPYALAFVDMRMPPGWDGIETTTHICRADPDLQIVLCTAYTDYSWEEILARIGTSDRLLILKKPFDNIEVSQLAHALTRKWRLVQESKRRLDDLEERVRERTADLENSNRKLQAEIAERGRTEEALRKSERHYREMANGLGEGVVFTDADHHFTFANPAAENLFRVWTGQLAGKRLEDFLDEQGRAIFHEQLKARRAGKKSSYELEIVTTNGERRQLLVTGTPQFSATGQFCGSFAVLHDITQRKQMEQAIRESQRLQKAILDNIPDPAWLKDNQGRYLLGNKSLAALCRSRLEDAPGEAGLEMFPAAAATPVPGNGKAAIPGKINRGERCLSDSAGRRRWFDTIETPVPNERGVIAGTVGIAHDITERKELEVELRQKTALFKAMVYSSPDGILVVDGQGRRVIQNEALTNLLKIPREIAEQPDNAALLSYVTEHLIKQPEPFLARIRCLYAHPDEIGRDEIELKDDRILDRISAPILSKNREYYGRIWTFRDITSRKRAEKQLRLQTSALETAANGIVITDRAGKILWVNPAFTRLTNYATDEAVGQTPALLKSGKQNRWFYETLWRTILDGNVWHGELVNRRKDGSLYDEEMTITPVCDESGAIQNFVAVKQDISERKLFEQTLARERDLLQALMDNGPDCIYFKDQQSRFVRFSKAFEKLFNVTDADQLRGKTDFDFFLEEHARAAYEDEQEIIRTGRPMIGKLEKETHPDGRVTWALTTKLPWRDRDGTIIGTFGISKDVTELQKAEQERQQMELQLRQSQKLEAIGQLAAGIAHEINTPTQYVGDNTRFLQDAFQNVANVLRNHGELLAAAKQNALTPEMLQRADEVRTTSDLDYLFGQIPAAITETLEGVERVTKIVRAMKEFSHPGGREKAPADLNKAIESTATVARNEWKYVADLKLDLAADLPLVPCFLGEFNQSMLNLIVNAAHAIGDVVKTNSGTKGFITVSTRRDGGDVEIRVADTGTGIAEIHRPHIFEPFFTTKDVGRGTGQGLALVYNTVVKRHGGTATFETEVGKGTTFILRLPITPPIAPSEKTANPSPPAA